MQEFNKVTTTSNFIKELLNTTYLPVLRTVQAGDYIIEGHDYLYKCDIITCQSTGYINPYNNATLSPIAKFAVIGEYTFGDKNGKLCTKYQSNSEGYDSKTHEYLGKYLRSLRDMYGLNLMPLYNCFSNNSFTGHHIFDTNIKKTAFDYRTKLYKLPIRFNTTYTICMENVGKTTFAPAFIRNENLIKIDKCVLGNDIDATNRYIALHEEAPIQTFSGLRFNSPITIRFNNIPENKVKTYYQETNTSEVSKVNLTVQDYFTAIQIGNESIYDTYLESGKLYSRANLSDNNKLGLQKVTSSDTFKLGTYYICNVNPSELSWYEDEKLTSVSKDTSIDISKTYYKKVTQLEKIEYDYSIENKHCEVFNNIEDHLYLLVQVPQEFEKNILILEGDYTKLDSEKLYNQIDLRDYPDNYLDMLFTHNLSLMRMNTAQVIPFSDTLIQFLLWNVICNMDDINLDMDRLLNNLNNLGLIVDEKYYANYWYYRYRELISNYAFENTNKYIDDNLGYVTSDIEQLLSRGRY